MLRSENYSDSTGISILLLLALLVNHFCSIYINAALCITVIAIAVLLDTRNAVFTKMPGGVSYFLMLFLFLCIGLMNYIPGERGYWPFIRDIIYFFGMLLYWMAGDIAAKKYQYSLVLLYKTVVLYIGISCLISVVQRVIALAGNTSSLYSLSLVGGMTQFNIAIGVYLLFFKPACIEDYYFGKVGDILLKIIVLLALFVSFSRTVLLMLAVFLLVGEHKSLSKVIQFIILAVIGVLVVSYLFPNIMTAFVTKLTKSLSEVSASKTTSWDDASVVTRWRGYEIYKAKQEFSEFPLINQIFGRGFGSTVDVGGYAHLVTGESALPYLHNGYYTTLIKGGWFGLILTAAYFITSLYYYWKSDIGSYEKRLAYGIIISMAVSMAFIHGTFWGGESLLGMLLLAWLSGGETAEVSEQASVINGVRA